MISCGSTPACNPNCTSCIETVSNPEPRLFKYFNIDYLKIDKRTPAATAEPITPDTLGPIACINKMFDLS